jgi:hypothetical protein
VNLLPKYKLNLNELMAHWHDQLDFIRSSAKLYDEGNENEARRIAVHLRILFHETSSSHSLIKQTGLINNIFLWSSGDLYTPSNLLPSWVLLGIMIKEQGFYYKPNGGYGRTFFMKYEDWWNEIIFDDKKNVFTRKDIVCFVANQDGGAHVDKMLDGNYAELVKHNSLGWTDLRGNPSINNPAYAAIRQIAEEVLVSQIIYNKGSFTREKQKDRLFEMRYIDDKRRFKWSITEINYSKETFEIINRYQKEDRTLYLHKYKDGTKIEVIAR